MIEALFPPCGTGLIVALRAYIDASIKNNDLITVAGVAFGMSNAVKASNAWKKVMGGKIFHMTDLHNTKGEFSDMSDQERGDMLKKLVPILSKRATFSVCVSMSMKELEKFLPQSSADSVGEQVLGMYKNPYSFCGQYAMYSLAELSRKHGNSDPIHYVLEAGDYGQKSSKGFIDYLYRTNWDSHREMYLMETVAYAEKDSVHTLLQASDFLAWEWGRYVQRHPDKMRVPLEITVGSGVGEFEDFGFGINTNSSRCMHFTGENIIENLKNMNTWHSMPDKELAMQDVIKHAYSPLKPPPSSIVL